MDRFTAVRHIVRHACPSINIRIRPKPASKVRGVHFEIASSKIPVRSRTLQAFKSSYKKATATVSGYKITSTTTRTEVKNLLCQSLMEANSNKCLPEILFDGTSIWHVPGMSTLKTQQIPSSIEHNTTDTSLAALLAGQERLNLKDRRILAVILGHSLLHFCESPWLNKQWNKEHISFFLKPGDFGIQHPYLSTDFQDTTTEDDAEAIFKLHPNASVLAFGILLLEMELHCVIETQRREGDLDDGKPTVNTDYFTALRVLKDASDNIYHSYSKAVTACLQCNFYNPDTMEPSLDDSDFRQAVYDHVVRPLENDLYLGFEIFPNDLVLGCD